MVFQLSAQIHTRSENRHWDMRPHERILIIPFEPRLIISDIHGDMCRKNDMDSQELRERLQEAIMASFPASSSDFDFVLAGMTGEDPPKQLFDLFRLVRYKYTMAPPLPDSEERIQLLDRLMPKNPEQKNRGVAVERGELNRYYDGKSRFMNPEIDATLIKELLEAYGCDRMCFLTEFDIRLEDPTLTYTPNPSAKILNLHFAWYNTEGEKRFAGLLSNRISETNYLLTEFSMLHFPELCAMTIATLPDWPVDEQDEAKERGQHIEKKNKISLRGKWNHDDEDY